MNYKNIKLIRDILDRVDVLRPNIQSIHNEQNHEGRENEELCEFLYQCKLRLRDMILSCLRYMTTSTEMVVDYENYIAAT